MVGLLPIPVKARPIQLRVGSQPLSNLVGPIQNAKGPHEFPNGGIWTSEYDPITQTSPWADQWAQDRESRWHDEVPCWLLRPQSSASVIPLRRASDLRALVNLFGYTPKGFSPLQLRRTAPAFDETGKIIADNDALAVGQQIDVEILQNEADGIYISPAVIDGLSLPMERATRDDWWAWRCAEVASWGAGTTFWFRWVFDEVWQAPRRVGNVSR